MTEPFDIEEDLLHDEEDDDTSVERRYADVGEWVENYFRYVVAGTYTNKEVAGQRTWCAVWWQHKAVAAPLAALHDAWEAARASDDPAAMSAWWVHHAHPHIRWLCDAQSGPMFRCSSSLSHGNGYDHTDDEHLTVIPAPLGWFDPPSGSDEDVDDDYDS